MASNAPDPLDVGTILTREQRLEQLTARADRPAGERVAVLSEEELLVVAELLDELNAITNPDGVTRDGWGRLARVMAVRVYDRLGI
ncbi:hypothetical protein [Actinoplanes sp. NBRC 101535]|uniref:hypothetical protein n=1 Tax=Actinoplanes sp. NBRC 101535 TaxID=3032196 RepID=UPI0024A4C62B|nr:hypothetical protein [Actinoplanes sp. NBRC 101535]GLY08252.1 hypothetical protein Acsp01_86310 [Actinoplanes sp. NBRC 101535]